MCWPDLIFGRLLGFRCRGSQPLVRGDAGPFLDVGGMPSALSTPIPDRCMGLHPFSLFEVSASSFDNSHLVFYLGAADNGDWAVSIPFHVGLLLVSLLWQLGYFDLGSRVNHSAGCRCGTR